MIINENNLKNSKTRTNLLVEIEIIIALHDTLLF